MPTTCDVIIVGAGLAGLRCAQVLEDAGLSVLLIERSPEVGGRLASRVVDGHVIDEGFQLINPAYPELRATGVLDDFDLRSFEPGLTLHRNGRKVELVDPRFSLLEALSMVSSRSIALRDIAALTRLFTRSALSPVRALLRGADVSTRKGLASAGLSENVIDDVMQPFLRGTLLDDELSSSWHYTQLLLRSFTRGRPGTHPDGIAALPRAMAKGLTTSELQLAENVVAVTGTSVRTANADYRSRAVVVATDPSGAQALLGGGEPTWRTQTTWWLSMARQHDTARLRIDLDDRLLNSVLDISSVAPERAPESRSLIAAPANGLFTTSEQDESVVNNVARLYDVSASDVDLVARTEVARALPVFEIPLRLARSQRRGDIVLAGDHLQTPSIQGALVSGRRAAFEVMATLHVGPKRR